LVKPPAAATPRRPMTMAEKILARHVVGASPDIEAFVRPGDAVVVSVDGGYTHEFTTAQVHAFLVEEYGEDYMRSRIPSASRSSRTT
jgi:3-isopropylmalate/(R)-2-methylmalate dehydratase large subunit